LLGDQLPEEDGLLSVLLLADGAGTVTMMVFVLCISVDCDVEVDTGVLI
jgi:hypothetical protein